MCVIVSASRPVCSYEANALVFTQDKTATVVLARYATFLDSHSITHASLTVSIHACR